MVSPVPQNGVRGRSIPCSEPVFWGAPSLPPAVGGSWTPQAAPCPPLLTLPFLFSLGFKKKYKCSPAWKCPPCLALVSPSGRKPAPPPGLAPALGWGTGSPPHQAHPVPTKMHKELSFKKAGGNLNADLAKGREF